MVYKYLSNVDFKKAAIGAVRKSGESTMGEWKIYNVKTKDDGKPFEFTMRITSEGLFTKDVEGKGKKFKVFSLPVDVKDRSFLDEGLGVLAKRLSKITGSPTDVEAGGENIWLKVPSRNDRILSHMSLDGEVVGKGDQEQLDEPVEGKVVVRLTGILLSGDGSARAQLSLLAADLVKIDYSEHFLQIEDDEEEDVPVDHLLG